MLERDRPITDNLEEQKQSVFKKLEICRSVRDVCITKGWKSIIEPTIERMIVDTIGGKVKGIWKGGALAEAKTEGKQRFYLGYKQFGIDLLNRIYNHILSIKKLEHQIESLNDEINAPTIVPLLERKSEPVGEVSILPCKGKPKRKAKRKRKKK